MINLIWSILFTFVASATKTTILQERFTSSDSFILDSSYSYLVSSFQERTALKLANTDIFSQNITVQYKKSITNFRGKALNFSVDYYNSRINTDSKESGVEFMYVLNRNGIIEYYKLNNNTWDKNPQWKTMSFIVYSEYTDVLSDGIIYFRLEGNGILYFSNMILEIIDNDLYPNWTIPNDFISQYTNKNINISKTLFRGAISPSLYNEKDYEEFKIWRGNIFRWQLRDLDIQDDGAYQIILNTKIKELELIIQKAEELNIWIIISLQSPPGGKDENGIYRLLYDKNYFNRYIELWENITKHFINSTRIWGYDIINEPMNYYGGYVHYLELQRLTIEKIRNINSNISIIVSSIRLNYTDMLPFNYPNIIYTLHYYNPYEYTYQGLEKYSETFEYPGNISGVYWNKEYIKNNINGFYNFLNKYKAKGLIGEFSVVRWAKGSTKYLSDLIEIFEEYGFDWIYRSFRDEQQWNVEYGNDKNNTKRLNTTENKELLLKYFNNNVFEESEEESIPEEEVEEEEKESEKEDEKEGEKENEKEIEKENEKNDDKKDDVNKDDSGSSKVFLWVIGSICGIILFFYLFYIIRKKRRQYLFNKELEGLLQ